MKRKYMLCVLMIFAILAGCAKDNSETNSKENNETNSKKNNENTTGLSQEDEYSAENTDALLEDMGIKSYDLWSYLRPDTGEETDSFLNELYEKTVSDLVEEHGEIANIPEKEEYIEDARKKIHARYKIEQKEPLIIKVNGKNENNTVYLSEKSWQESAYFYISPNGQVFKDNDKWYEIQGYGDYKTEYWNTLGSINWGYAPNKIGAWTSHLYGYDKRDGDEYNEERVKECFFPVLLMKQEYKDGSCTYMCDNLTVHAYYRVYYLKPEEMLTGKKSINVYIGFYVMLGESRAVVCNYDCFTDDDSTMDYYNDITEEKLREIFTIREYK